MAQSSINNITKLIQKLSYRHQTWQVFSDFLEMSAISISNSVDLWRREEREKQYLNTVSRYEPKEIDVFSELFAELIKALEDTLSSSGPGDILGRVFHELELHNKWKGQFFTPDHICEMMGETALGDRDPIIQEKGYVTVSEPCSGSGAMVLGFAKAMKKRGYNYCNQMVVTAVDVDLKCVYMTYLQLSLYGIPAVVICGDTLLAKECSRWHTPVYILDGWQWKQECGITTKLIANQAPGLPEPEKVENVEHVGQLSLIDLDKAS